MGRFGLLERPIFAANGRRTSTPDKFCMCSGLGQARQPLPGCSRKRLHYDYMLGFTLHSRLVYPIRCALQSHMQKKSARQRKASSSFANPTRVPCDEATAGLVRWHPLRSARRRMHVGQHCVTRRRRRRSCRSGGLPGILRVLLGARERVHEYGREAQFCRRGRTRKGKGDRLLVAALPDEKKEKD